MPAMPSSLASGSDGCGGLIIEAGEDDEGSSFIVVERGSSSSDKRDSSTALSVLRGRVEVVGMEEDEEGESLFISSPMMARGAQPYMAQDLDGGSISLIVLWEEVGVG